MPALEVAEAPLVARMDTDDCCLPRLFELQVARMDAGDVGAVGCRGRYFPEEQLQGRAFGVCAVGRQGGREALRRALTAAGWREGEEFRGLA